MIAGAPAAPVTPGAGGAAAAAGTTPVTPTTPTATTTTAAAPWYTSPLASTAIVVLAGPLVSWVWGVIRGKRK